MHFSTVLIKRGWLHFGRFFNELIWSPYFKAIAWILSWRGAGVANVQNGVVAERLGIAGVDFLKQFRQKFTDKY
jgi:hypothetical protein